MDEQWEDRLLFVVVAVMQWVSRRYVGVMAVLDAASLLPVRDSELAMSMTMLCGVIFHNLSMLSTLAAGVEDRMRGRRRLWVIERSGGVWEDLQLKGERHEKVFRRFFRLLRPVFNDILQRIGPYIQRAITNWRQPLPAEQKFSCVLIRWATGGFYRQSGHGLGMGLVSALRSNKDVVEAIIREYGHVLSFPEGRRLQEVMDAFERKGFPGCVGAVDCIHLYIEKPRNEHAACYYDRTGRFSIIAKVICDHKCRILVFVGCPGSCHDIRVLKHSTLTTDYDKGVGVLHSTPATLRDGSSIDRFLLGDAGYPLLSWFMTPHPTNRPRTPEQVVFDDMHMTTRSCIERTFGFIKHIWRNFGRRHISNLKTICKEFMACCILHNILLDYKVDMNGLAGCDSDDSDDDSDEDCPQPPPYQPPLYEGEAMSEHIGSV
ncbi:hypothetical protein CBR_g993 [Chara braunii]|uniref:DDE Tnp4 domain-containing protein n=1 Tax=Chara braunii TaxID=69332 RepID=A0A388KCS9_CHABU|nr:hypothetical protein CBR_g993 [Chara braunii]|eukprot:GBG67874.1 hypothetical protein CBR_g993 [Chara braunii]